MNLDTMTIPIPPEVHTLARQVPEEIITQILEWSKTLEGEIKVRFEIDSDLMQTEFRITVGDRHYEIDCQVMHDGRVVLMAHPHRFLW